MARLIARGAHVVVRKHHLRKSDFRTGQRLDHDDHIIRLEKPQRLKWMSKDPGRYRGVISPALAGGTPSAEPENGDADGTLKMQETPSSTQRGSGSYDRVQSDASGDE